MTLESVKEFIKTTTRPIRKKVRLAKQRRRLKYAPSKKVVIGSSGTQFDGWVATDRETVDLLNERTWQAFWQPGALDAILAEHVWEHLSADGALKAAKICHTFLRPGGHLRVAVPDGFHPVRAYIESVRPGGSGPGADDHHVLYTYKSLRDVFTQAGFEVRLLEYFDENHDFHFAEWSPEDGMIQRSKRYDARNLTSPLAYTSVVLDAVKPLRVAPVK